MNKNTLLQVVLAVLVVAAAVLGLMIFMPSQEGAVQSPTPAASGTPVSNGAYAPQGSAQADAQRVLEVPAQGSAPEVFEAHFRLAESVAVASNTLEVGDCKIDPIVLQVIDGGSFMIKNSSKEVRVISFGSDLSIAVQPGASHKMEANFKNGSGLYGFGCDKENIQKTSGFVLVTPKS